MSIASPPPAAEDPWWVFHICETCLGLVNNKSVLEIIIDNIIMFVQLQWLVLPSNNSKSELFLLVSKNDSFYWT